MSRAVRLESMIHDNVECNFSYFSFFSFSSPPSFTIFEQVKRSPLSIKHLEIDSFSRVAVHMRAIYVAQRQEYFPKLNNTRGNSIEVFSFLSPFFFIVIKRNIFEVFADILKILLSYEGSISFKEKF